MLLFIKASVMLISKRMMYRFVVKILKNLSSLSFVSFLINTVFLYSFFLIYNSNIYIHFLNQLVLLEGYKNYKNETDF